MMAAAILADAPLELLGVPRLTDVRTMARLLRQLGVDVARHGDRLRVDHGRYPRGAGPLRLGAADAGRILRPWAAAGAAGQGGGAAARRLRHRRPARRSAPPRAGRPGRGSAAGARLRRGHGPAASRRHDRPLRSPRPHGDGHGERPLRRRARPRAHGHPRRGPRAGDRRPRPHVELAGGADLRSGHAGHRNRRGGAARRGLLPHHSRSHRSGNAHARRGHHRRRGECRGAGARSLANLARQAGSERNLDRRAGRPRDRAGRCAGRFP